MIKRVICIQFNSKLKATQRWVRFDRTEINFARRTEFERFVKHMTLLTLIRNHRPRSIYALAKAIRKDVANVSKVVLFYESHGVIEMQNSVIQGRKVKTPFVEFDEIIFEIRETPDWVPPPKNTRAILRLARRR